MMSMTGFSTCCWKNVSRLLCALACCVVCAAYADGITTERVALVASQDNGSYRLEADYQVALNSTLIEALNKGVPLYFLFEFDIVRPRWYWFDAHLAQIAQSYRLSYDALTRQYRLGLDGFFQSFGSLDEALSFLEHMRHSDVVRFDDLRHGDRYEASARLQLDVSQLPKPFQLDALGSSDWDLDSGWYQWELKP